MRYRKKIWTLLYKKDIWRYEPLRKKEIAGYIKHGWKVIK